MNYYVYATDDSASTQRNSFFHTNGLKTVKIFHKEVKKLQTSDGSNKDDKILYLHWSDKCVKVEKDEVISRYDQQISNGSKTLPLTILDWFERNLAKGDKIKLLFVITGGAVNYSEEKRYNPNMVIENVTFYAFNTNVDCIDMSVASKFMYNNKSYTVYCNEEMTDQADLSNPFDYNQINIENFDVKKGEMKSYIKLQFLTKSSTNQMALDEIKKLKKLRSRLYKELAFASKNIASLNLNVKDKEVFIKTFKNTTFYKSLMDPNYDGEKQNIESCINVLINYISTDKKSFKFDNLTFEKKFTPETKEEEVFNVHYGNVEKISFPDNIRARKSAVPVILLTHCNLFQKILFNDEAETANFSRFRNTIECPLFLMYDEHIRGSIESFYNLDTFKSMMQHGMRTGPRTRQPFTGAIVPLEEFDDYNDYILACTYFDGKQVPYNKGLLYYVLWKTCEKLEHIEQNVVKYLKGYILKRIAKTKCVLGLSTESINDPLIQVNLTTALWYCVELSSTIFKDDPTHFTLEKLRMYGGFAEHMKEILLWFQYTIDEKSINIRADIFKHLIVLKCLSRPQDKVKYILEQIFAQKKGFLVANIAKPENIFKLNYLKLDLNQPINEKVIGEKVCVDNFVHIMDHIGVVDIPICRQTMRPNFVTKNKKSFYERLIMVSSKVLVKKNKLVVVPVRKVDFKSVLSLYKQFI